MAYVRFNMVAFIPYVIFTILIMKRKDIYTLAILMLLTLSTAFFSHIQGLKLISFLILFLSGIKFILVAFQFMGLKKAHNTWKILLIGYLIFFIGSVSVILN